MIEESRVLELMCQVKIKTEKRMLEKAKTLTTKSQYDKEVSQL
jgi:hypothetical protein